MFGSPDREVKQMNCEEAKRLMDGYLDGELDPITNQKIEAHLRDCTECDEAYQAHRAFIGAIRSGAPYHKAPAKLRERIQLSLREQTAKEPMRNVVGDAPSFAPRAQRTTQAAPFGTSWSWLALAAGIIVAGIIALNFMPQSRRPGDEQFLATQLIASHARSLLANHLTDVPSSDQHTVKPWLDSKLDFAPAVVDLSNEGFPLIGGRLDYLDHRPVAALVYGRRKHFINLFIWPAAADAKRAPETMSRQGYQLLHWADLDFNYWAVSDVNVNDLQTFKQHFEAQTSRH
jgi:anti-sigma factor (TIGR02949 family)